MIENFITITVVGYIATKVLDKLYVWTRDFFTLEELPNIEDVEDATAEPLVPRKPYNLSRPDEEFFVAGTHIFQSHSYRP